MPCEHWETRGGGSVIICTSRGRRRRQCVVCGQPASLECDGRIEGADKTCDAPLCRPCAVRGPEKQLVTVGDLHRWDTVDFCPRCAAAGGRAMDSDEIREAYRPATNPRAQPRPRYRPAAPRALEQKRPECSLCQTVLGPGMVHRIPLADDPAFLGPRYRLACGLCADRDWDRNRAPVLPGFGG